jgi:hypothetical protein
VLVRREGVGGGTYETVSAGELKLPENAIGIALAFMGLKAILKS